MRPHLLGLVLVLSSLCVQTDSRLYLAKLITVSDQTEILVKTKYKFTDVMMTSRTVSALQVFNVTDQTSIPEVPVRNSGRSEKKYHKLDYGHSVYLFSEVMDSQQLKTSFQRVASTNGTEAWLYILESSSKGLLQGLSQKEFCFSSKNLTAVVKSTDQVKEMFRQCQSQLSQTTATPSGQQKAETLPETIPSLTPEFTMGCFLLLTFCIVKTVLLRIAARTGSVV